MCQWRSTSVRPSYALIAISNSSGREIYAGVGIDRERRRIKKKEDRKLIQRRLRWHYYRVLHTTRTLSRDRVCCIHAT